MTKEINVNDIVQSNNSRAIYKAEELNQLMGSIQNNGLLEPIGLRFIGNKKYEVVYGNRRFLSVKKLGWATIEAKILDADDKNLLTLNMIENLQRKDLTSMEEGMAFDKLKKDHGLSNKEISARLGITIQRVESSLAVNLKIPEKFAQRVVPTLQGKKSGKIPASNALILSEIAHSNKLTRSQTEDLFERATKENFNSSNVRLIGKLMRRGFSSEEALLASESARSVDIRIMLNRDHAKKLEKKYKLSITTIIYQKLLMDQELRILHSKDQKKKISMKVKKENRIEARQ